MGPQRISTDLPTEVETGIATPGLAGQDGRVYLVVRIDQEVRVLELLPGGELLVGRTEEADVRVDHPRVSRRHTRISRGPAGLQAEDLGSRNGTTVSGERVVGAAIALAGGDVLQIGPAEIVVAVGGGEPIEEALPVPPTADTEDDMPPGVVVAETAMRKLFQTVRRLAGTPTTVLIVGETGVGKEVIAERLHAWSPRAAGPFVRLNCASVPESLLESELFGHERGAFTGADARRDGYFQAAHGGTLMLDEVGELPAQTQAKLLRAVETRRIARLGSTQESTIDVRLVCATHRDLVREVAEGRFRQDLYYRLSTFTLQVPPLRTRPTELLLLARLFARQLAKNMGAAEPALDRATVQALLGHDWPGNVRELRNALEHAVILADGDAIRPEHLPASVVGTAPAPATGATAGLDVRDRIAAIERRAVEEALTAEGGNQTRAARRLGLTRRALIYRMEKYHLRR